jgi:hypothetical protein
MDASSYLVFGDLHGRVLPAFRLATVWAREYDRRVAGILQVGDLGYFPDLAKLDKATRRFADDDPLELGTHDIIADNELADAVFGDPDCPAGLWFTAGNHEDFEALQRLSQSAGREPDFAVDAYGRVRGIKNGDAAIVGDALRVGALWVVDGEGANRRTNLAKDAFLSRRKADQLLARSFDVLLTHDAPAHAKRFGYGSAIVNELIQLAQPAFAFFGHYKGEGARIDGDFGKTQLYHLAGMELRGPGGTAEAGCAGVLTWHADSGAFEFIDSAWLKTFSRHNWKWR